ncbi:MAG: glutamate racemase [Deltaproteobacteria bacterium]|nr:glutamate racemase [Deltaproteobacteria bacterium]
MNHNAAIGVFDSGIGGLTVAREIARELPGETLIYLGDTARLPYGSKSAETVIKYAVRNVSFLAKSQLKAIVVACNTVSSVALPALREIVSVPVLGVIEPGARAAVAATRSGIIGVIGQPGTIRSGRYESAILQVASAARIYSRPTPLLVPLAEEGWVGTEVARLVLKEYLTPLVEKGIDTLVLGCTHYPLFKEQLNALFATEHPRDIVLVDSAVSIAVELRKLLTSQDLLADAQPPSHRFFATDSTETFARVGRNFWGEDFPQVLHVDL